jgi:hypothetical protein
MGLNRKQFKIKRHSCALCKPNKVGWAPRFNERERLLAKVHLAEIRELRG